MSDTRTDTIEEEEEEEDNNMFGGGVRYSLTNADDDGEGYSADDLSSVDARSARSDSLGQGLGLDMEFDPRASKDNVFNFDPAGFEGIEEEEEEGESDERRYNTEQFNR